MQLHRDNVKCIGHYNWEGKLVEAVCWFNDALLHMTAHVHEQSDQMFIFDGDISVYAL